MLKETGKYLLSPARMLSLRKSKGFRIECLQGFVWITSQGESADIFLRSGQQHAIANNGQVLIEALEESIVRLRRNKQKPGLSRPWG